jgi:hypothetical protein
MLISLVQDLQTVPPLDTLSRGDNTSTEKGRWRLEMTDDPFVLILYEAAARGRQLRLAREQAAQNRTRSDDDASEVQPSDPVAGTTMTPQRGDDAVAQVSSI